MTIGLFGGLKTIATFLNITGFTKKFGKKDHNLIMANGSITTMLDELIVEPTFVVTRAVADSSSYDNLIQVNLNLFASLYSNAFMNLVEIKDIKAKSALTVLRSGKGNRINKKWTKIGNNSDLTDVDYDELVKTIFNKNTISENETITDIKVSNEASASNRDGKHSKEPEILNKHLLLTATVVDSNNSDEKTKKYKEIKVPIIIRAEVHVVDTQEMIDYCTLSKEQYSLTNRIHKYRSGGLTHKEFWFAQDMIRDFGQKLNRQGKSRILENLENRKIDAIGNNTEAPIGLGRDYGSIFIHSTERKQLDLAIRGDIDDEYTKDKLLHNIASFNLNIVNDDWEKISIFTSGFKGVVRIPFDKLKSKDDSDKMKTMFETLLKGSSSKI
jgi:hypothetical protein